MNPVTPRALAAALIALTLFGTLAPSASTLASADAMPDPADPGPFEVVRTEYNFGETYVNINGPGTSPLDVSGYPAKLNGSVHYPASGAGPFPLVVLMHGRHATCRVGGSETIGQSLCLDPTLPVPVPVPVKVPVNTDPIDSYTGYDYLAANLASHGYVVASANANDVNDHDQQGDYGSTARAQILLRTIDRFGLLNQAQIPAALPVSLLGLAGRIDMTRIGLMGHSRGGEGASRAITLNAAGFEGGPRSLKAVFALAPTDFSRPQVAGVAWMTLLPYCDGDVSGLWGARIYDDARLAGEASPTEKGTVLAMGANHNFYNTVWTYDDVNYSFPSDSYCGRLGTGAGRETPADQRKHGLDVMASFFRYHLGGESAFGPFLAGAIAPPASACPANAASCPDLLHWSRMLGADRRLLVEDAKDAATLSANDLGGASTFTGFVSASVCTPSSCPGNDVARASQVYVRWNAPATYATALPVASRDVSTFDALTMRAALAQGDALNPSGQSTDYRIVLTDAAGASASVRASDVSTALFWPPGAGFAAKVVLSDVRVPLTAFAGVDLTHVASVKLVFDVKSAGAVTLNDLAFQREG